MNPAVRVTRDVLASDEHNYTGRDVKEGEIFYRYDGHTYGCVRYPGIALTVKPGEYPFFEFPADAIEDAEDARAGYKGMGYWLMAKRQAKFNHKLYRQLARLIHKKLCEDEAWCNYGKPVPGELRHDESLPREKQRELAGKRLDWYHHCQYAVDAENIAARVQFGKGSKVRR